jgi:hypothetical protein
MRAAFLTLLVAGLQPDGWVRHPGPGSEFAGDRMCANHSRRQWSVVAVGAALQVSAAADEPNQEALPFPISFVEAIDTPPPPPASPTGDASRWDPAQYAESHARRVVCQLESGWLIGFNAGEYGGSLWWYPSTGGPGRKLLADNVVALLPSADAQEAVVLTGLAHLGFDKGKAWRVHMGNGVPGLQALVDLGGAPQASTRDRDGSVLVVVNQGVLRLSPDGLLTRVCSVDYSALYPTSVAALPDGSLFVGMRHFLTHLTPGPSTCNVEWLAPKDCRRFLSAGERCECRP